MLPRKVTEPLRDQLQKARELFVQDREAGAEPVWLPHALTAKYGHSDVSTTMIYTHVMNNLGSTIFHATLKPKARDQEF